MQPRNILKPTALALLGTAALTTQLGHDEAPVVDIPEPSPIIQEAEPELLERPSILPPTSARDIDGLHDDPSPVNDLTTGRATGNLVDMVRRATDTEPWKKTEPSPFQQKLGSGKELDTDTKPSKGKLVDLVEGAINQGKLKNDQPKAKEPADLDLDNLDGLLDELSAKRSAMGAYEIAMRSLEDLDPGITKLMDEHGMETMTAIARHENTRTLHEFLKAGIFKNRNVKDFIAKRNIIDISNDLMKEISTEMNNSGYYENNHITAVRKMIRKAELLVQQGVASNLIEPLVADTLAGVAETINKVNAGEKIDPKEKARNLRLLEATIEGFLGLQAPVRPAQLEHIASQEARADEHLEIAA